MKKIASLADDERVPKKRRKGNGGMFYTLCATTSAQFALPQMTCLGLTMPTGPFIARSYVVPVRRRIVVNPNRLCLEHDRAVL